MRRRSALTAAALLASSFITAVAVDHPVEAADPPSGFSDVAIANVNSGTTVEWLPNTRIIVLEQETGRVRIAEPGGPLSTALDIASVCGDGERGMLGFTHDPAFLGNGWVYLYYTHRGANGCVNRVSRFTMIGATIDPATELVLLDNIASTGTNHNGGDLDFGSDGYLYVGIGDAGRDPRGDSGASGSNDAAQDLSLLNGKIARITSLGAPAPGNPFTGAGTAPCRTSGTAARLSTRCQEIYSWGLRNPYRFAFDRNDGADTFFINDVGQGTFEEVNVGQIGNFGWPSREGPCPQGQTSGCADPRPGEIDPITHYGRNRGTYITAGAFVPDGLWPSEYDGAYLFGDGGSGNIWMRSAAGTVDYDAPFATGAYGLTDMTFGFDADGTMVLYYVQVSGGLRMIKPDGVTDAPKRGDLKFVPITPTRPYDTGNSTGGPAGNVVNGTTRLIDLDAPAGARAALVNLTYDRTAGPGFIRAWAARTARPQTSSLNADRVNTIAANAAVVALADDGSFVIESSTTSRVVVDVMGWFVDTAGSSDDGRFVTVDPARSVDTREPAGSSLTSGSTNRWSRSGDDIAIGVRGELGIPGDGTAQAIVLSIAAIPKPFLAGFVGGYPGGTAYTGTSNVNVLPGEIRANMLVIPLGSSSDVTLRARNIDDVVVDVLGYITGDAAPTNGSGLYNTLEPTRIADTRNSNPVPTLQGRTPVEIPVPAAARGAAAVVQNIAVTNTAAAGYVAAHPTRAIPVVSSVNYDAAGQTRAAFAFTTMSTGDSVFFTSLVRSDLVVDVVGYFAS